jgi:hypothetical protein
MQPEPCVETYRCVPCRQRPAGPRMLARCRKSTLLEAMGHQQLLAGIWGHAVQLGLALARGVPAQLGRDYRPEGRTKTLKPESPSSCPAVLEP